MHDETANRFSWSTDMARPEDRQRLWREHYTDVFIQTDFESLDGDAFYASIRYEQFGGLGLGAITSMRERYTVTAPQAKRNPDGFMLDLVRVGRCGYRQGAFDVMTEPGGGVFLHNQMPSLMWSADPSETLSISIPAEAITRRMGEGGHLIGRALRPDQAETRLLMAYLKAVESEAERAAPATRALIASQIADLIVAAIGHDQPGAAEAGARGTRAARFRLASEAIARRYTEPMLNGERIAEALGVSDRYLQRLFEEHGQTISGRIRERRLEAVRSALADPRQDHRAISDLAQLAGFSDIASFNRAYRRRFGEAPSAAPGFRMLSRQSTKSVASSV
jgi:AraC-like DNA-binding protein